MAHKAGSYPRVRPLTAAESGDRDRLEAERLNMYLTALRPPSPPAASVGAYQSAARSSARYKGAFVPRCFFNSSLNPLSSLLPFSCAGVAPQAAASSIPLPRPRSPQRDTAQPVRKMPHHNCRLLFARPLGNIVSSTITTMDLPSTMTPTKCLAFQVPGGLFAQPP
jgi:hypothetical protein